MRIFKRSDAGPMPKGGVPKRGPLNWTVVRDIDGHRGCTLKLCNPRG